MTTDGILEILKSHETQRCSILQLLGVTLKVTEKHTFTHTKCQRRICCGQGHDGCGDFTLESGSSVTLKRYKEAPGANTHFAMPRFLISTTKGDFIIYLKRLRSEIESGLFGLYE